MKTPLALKGLTRWVSTCCTLGVLLFRSVLTGELHAQDFDYTIANGSITITNYTGPGATSPSRPPLTECLSRPLADRRFWAWFGLCIRWLHEPDQRDDPRQRYQPRELCIRVFRESGQRHSRERRHPHRRPCLPCLPEPDQHHLARKCDHHRRRG